MKNQIEIQRMDAREIDYENHFWKHKKKKMSFLCFSLKHKKERAGRERERDPEGLELHRMRNKQVLKDTIRIVTFRAKKKIKMQILIVLNVNYQTVKLSTKMEIYELFKELFKKLSWKIKMETLSSNTLNLLQKLTLKIKMVSLTSRWQMITLVTAK